MGYNCNNHCEFCLFGDLKKITPMTYLEVIDNIDFFINRHQINELVLSGGEPLIRSDIKDIILYAKKCGIVNIYLHTNALSNDKELIRFLRKNITKIMISAHNLDNRFQQKMFFIKRILDSNIRVRTNTLLLRKNYLMLNDILKKLVKNDVRNILLTFPFPIGMEMFWKF